MPSIWDLPLGSVHTGTVVWFDIWETETAGAIKPDDKGGEEYLGNDCQLDPTNTYNPALYSVDMMSIFRM